MSRRSQRLVTTRYYPGDDDATTSSSSSSLLGGQQLPFKESTSRLVGCRGGGVQGGSPPHQTWPGHSILRHGLASGWLEGSMMASWLRFGMAAGCLGTGCAPAPGKARCPPPLAPPRPLAQEAAMGGSGLEGMRASSQPQPPPA